MIHKDILIETEKHNLTLSDEGEFLQIIIESEELSGLFHLDYDKVYEFALGLLKQCAGKNLIIENNLEELRLHDVMFNEVKPCRSCASYNQGRGLKICRKCFNRTHFAKKIK